MGLHAEPRQDDLRARQREPRPISTASQPVADVAGRYWAGAPVRLVYRYRDGHDYTTETMQRAEAVAYMPLLHATPVDADHYEAAFGTIELRCP